MAVKVLIVERAPVLRSRVVTELSGDFTIVEAATVREAIGQLVLHPDLDAIVTAQDLGPGPRGVTLLAASREHAPSCARLLLADDVEQIDHLSADVVDAVIATPWRRGALRRDLLDACGRASSRRSRNRVVTVPS